MVQEYLLNECPGSPIKPNFQRICSSNSLNSKFLPDSSSLLDGPDTPSRPFKSFFMFGSALKTGSPFSRQKSSSVTGNAAIKGKTLSSAFNEAKQNETL